MKAVGGVDAFKKYKSMRVVGTFDIPAQGFQQVIPISALTYDDVREEEMALPPDIRAQLHKKP